MSLSASGNASLLQVKDNGLDFLSGDVLRYPSYPAYPNNQGIPAASAYPSAPLPPLVYPHPPPKATVVVHEKHTETVVVNNRPGLIAGAAVGIAAGIGLGVVRALTKGSDQHHHGHHGHHHHHHHHHHC